tara:strand:- start:1320 stop:1784 length:465 start_codon:yes stop_codon:yes gene_type:complete
MLMKFFIAGIMQGSLIDPKLHTQNYRTLLSQWITDAFTEAKVYDPLTGHNDSIDYDDTTGKRTFYHHNHMCGHEIDILIAFAPEASMGTAIEMWEAYRNRKIVITISPMAHNWVVKFCSHMVLESLEDFQAALQNNSIQQLISQHNPQIDPLAL